jgi:hypothetical protein
MQLTVKDILDKRGIGRMQSVGPMQVIPILGQDDHSFAPPDVEAGTSNYGQVFVRNRQGRDTIIPPGSAWIVARAVQDHAIGGGALIPAMAERTIDKAMCIQQSQAGLIKAGEHPLQILPAGLRVKALELRHEGDYSRLWTHISRFKQRFELPGVGNFVDFLKCFHKELDEFVAEFELVDGQLGAIVLIDGRVAGIEVAPSTAYWDKVWVPLIRVCYGALALQSIRNAGTAVPPSTRVPLEVLDNSLEGLTAALEMAEQAEQDVAVAVVLSVADKRLRVKKRGSDSLNGAKLHAVESAELIGQVVRKNDEIKYASLIATGA